MSASAFDRVVEYQLPVWLPTLEFGQLGVSAKFSPRAASECGWSPRSEDIGQVKGVAGHVGNN